MSLSIGKPMAACLLAACLSFSVSARAEEQPITKSATLARDINGFELGMTVAEARSLATLKFNGGDQYEAKVDGFEYNFGVTPLGRIYRVQSKQNLGRFAVDQQFLAALARRLTDKYGEPNSRLGGVFQWRLLESVTNAEGVTLPFTTMWMSASIGGFGDGHATLEITIIDFRVLWIDEAAVNSGPREAAEGQIRF